MKYSIFFSKEKKQNKISHLLDFHKASYCKLFNNSKFSINNFFKDFFPIYSNNNKKILEYVSYSIKNPELSFIECRNLSLSFCYKIYVILKFINKSTKFNCKKKIFFCDIPILTRNCSFLINGIERTIVSKITKSPGIQYSKNKVQIIPLIGYVLIIYIDNNGKTYFKYKNKAYLLNKLLDYFDIKNESIFNGEAFSTIFLIKNKYYIKYFDTNKIRIISKKKIIGTKLYKAVGIYKKDYVIKKDFFLNKINEFYVYNVIFKKYSQNKKNSQYDELIDKKKFFLSKTGRIFLNERIMLLKNNNLALDKETIYLVIKRLLNNSLIEEDMDDIKYKRILCCGNLILNTIIKSSFSYINIIKEKLKIISNKQNFLINFNGINNSIKDFFCSSNLSQFLEQTNFISEITHKRRICVMSCSRNVPKKIRDVNISFYGRICPIETPEGVNIGLINSLSIFCKIDNNGLLLSPYLDKKNKKILYLNAFEEKNIVFSSLKKYKFNKNMYSFSRKNNTYYITLNKFSKFKDFSPVQFISVASSMIPFLEYNDSNRTLMGANMLRQAIPCIKADYPYINTGFEKQIIKNIRKEKKYEGKIIYKDFKYIVIKNNKKLKIVENNINERTNQNTTVRKFFNAKVGDILKKKKIFKYACIKNKMISLGRNLKVAFLIWRGYNYEDSIVISEKVIRKDYFTSLHSEKVEIIVGENNLISGKITQKVPNLSNKKIKKLNKNGIIKLGTYVKEGDILIGRKILCKNISFTPEERIFNAIKKNKKPNIIDYSFRTPKGIFGVVSEILFYKKKKKRKNIIKTIKKANEHSKRKIKGIKKIIIIINHRKKLSVGDKMSGRYGNKGVVAKIIPEYDMPFTNDGTSYDIILNPLSVPSRMNIGQLIELKYGFLIILIKKYIKFYIKKKRKINKLYKIIFKKRRKINSKEFYKKINICSIQFKKKKNKKFKRIINFIRKDNIFRNLKISKENKIDMRDGKTGKNFFKSISVGTMYYLKLFHTVDTKIHARSIGPYSLITQQPLKGKSQFGGQRLGEMEVWALEAYGASHTLHEMLTIKSDDIEGRKITYKNIIKNKNNKFTNSSESLKILINEIKSLGIEIKIE
ncbi:DNA-directed RNA polymerase subunit beta [Candidatus Vidania fulgoroideorum]